uniref:Uncharacterized protein n=1 Tax=Chromera velia CCMP2878 TaxID=1169474 RepID=A0A0K6S7X6_9ALVE|eukprot:Cvel_21739.t1-p1 / transcript=Cvel_21739.t1 / gene=Cvel_21739 / organism=Chromera_velia_CCMP2878 / gene_product=hypothetical protein / transcript_product=hypothetical protein / location=Cvel_scaffold2065:2259-3449(+) / protein_length=397 / sequence_SO=supercontig / SO=protein_coding / is_pseudo=false
MDSAPPAGQLQPVLESACSTVLSAVMGLRVFWKFSAACKTLLKLRDDASDKGLGCMFLPEVLFPLSERFAVRSLLQHAVKRDDPKPLTQMQKVQGFAVDTFYPGLLAYALEKSACACIDLLTLQRPPPSLPCPGLSAATVGKMDPVTLSILLQRKVLHPDAWFDVEDVWYEGGDGIFFEDASEDGLGKHTLKYHKPLLNVLIDAHNFSGAELVLKVGARTDMYEWRGEEDFKKGDKNHSRNWQTGFHFLGKTPLHSAILTLPPPPLFHLETAGLTSYTCPPFDSQPPAAAAASASAVVGDRPKDSRAKGLELIVSLAKSANEAGCLYWTARLPRRALWDGISRNVGRTEREKESEFELIEVTAVGIASARLDPDIVMELLGARQLSGGGRGLIQLAN